MATDVRKFIPEGIPQTKNGSWKTGVDIYGDLRQVLIQPKTPDTMYDIGIKDDSGMLIFVKYDVHGPLATEDLNIVMFPGEHQLIIENATRDEEFRVKLIYQL